MSPLFSRRMPGEDTWAVWDVIVFPSDDAVTAQPDFRPPPSRVWLVGPGAPCEASVVGTKIDVDEYVRAATIWLQLRDCPGNQWAPVGLIAEESLVQDLTWRPKLPTTTIRGSLVEGAVDPFIESLKAEINPTHPEHGAGTIHIDVEYVFTSPPLAEAGYGAGWRPGATRCPADYIFKTKLGFLTDDQLVPLPCGDCPVVADQPACEECSLTRLVGAIAKKDEPVFVVLRDVRHEARVFAKGDLATHVGSEQLVRVPTIELYDEDIVENRVPPWACTTEDHP
jgi:hypothetical protein